MTANSKNTVLNDSDNFEADGIDLFGLSSVKNSRWAEIEEMFTPETWEIFKNGTQRQLNNDKYGRKVSDELAEMAFGMLLRNGFEQIQVDHSSLEEPAPCASGIYPSQIFFSRDEFLEDTEDGEWVQFFQNYETDEKIQEISNIVSTQGFFGLDLEDDLHWELAKKWGKVEADNTLAVEACGTCPLRAQCISSSITIPTSNGGFTDDSCVDAYGIYGGLDYDSRSYVHRKMVPMVREYKKQLREDEILVVDSNSDGLDEEQWEAAMSGEEIVEVKELSNEDFADEYDELNHSYEELIRETA